MDMACCPCQQAARAGEEAATLATRVSQQLQDSNAKLEQVQAAFRQQQRQQVSQEWRPHSVGHAAGH